MADQPTKFPDGVDLVAALNRVRGGFELAIGLQFTKVTPDEVACTVPVGPQVMQPYGLVHGGVYSTIVETLASAGAALVAMSRGQTSVGLENTTSFLHAVREGTLHGVAVPLSRGRRSQVWEVRVTDDAGNLAATGRVRTISLEKGAQIAGETVAVKT